MSKSDKKKPQPKGTVKPKSRELSDKDLRKVAGGIVSPRDAQSG